MWEFDDQLFKRLPLVRRSGSPSRGAALKEPLVLVCVLFNMILHLFCRLFSGCAGESPPKPEQTAAPTATADLGQREAKNEARREDQLKHMGGGTEARAAQSYPASSQPIEALTSRARPEQSAAPRTSADLGQKEAKVGAQSKEQSRHMEAGPKARPAQQKKAKRRPR